MRILIKAAYLLVILLILGLFFYDNVTMIDSPTHSTYLKRYIDNPQEYGGVLWGGWGKVINSSSDYSYFNIGGIEVKAKGANVEKAIYGETNLYLNLTKEGTIILMDYHNHNYYYFLYLSSFLALIIFLIIFFKEWRITSGGFKDA